MTVLEAYGERSATEATMEPPVTKSRYQGARIPDERAGFYRAEAWGREGHPIVDRGRKKKRKNHRRDKTRFSTNADVGRREC